MIRKTTLDYSFTKFRQKRQMRNRAIVTKIFLVKIKFLYEDELKTFLKFFRKVALCIVVSSEVTS